MHYWTYDNILVSRGAKLVSNAEFFTLGLCS